MSDTTPTTQPVESGRAYHPFWATYPGDRRYVDPLPEGACPERIYHEGDPSTPCVLVAGHTGFDHVDPEGYTAPNWDD